MDGESSGKIIVSFKKSSLMGEGTCLLGQEMSERESFAPASDFSKGITGSLCVHVRMKLIRCVTGIPVKFEYTLQLLFGLAMICFAHKIQS